MKTLDLPMARPVPPGAGEFRLPSPRQPMVRGVLKTPVGPVPRVDSRLGWAGLLGMARVRCNIRRDHYRVEPGLYALGEPGADSPVLVTANYRYSFDVLRRDMATGPPAWILVLDTRGINVWCAAGKGTFGTEELLDRIQASRLDEVVRHRRLILPQLGATGVDAWAVRRHGGFQVVHGPVDSRHLPAFLERGCRATPAMRRRRFPLSERLALIPVELGQALGQVAPLLALCGLAAALAGPDSARANLHALALPLALATLGGTLAGTVLTPVLLPWLPGRAFSLKGGVVGLACGLALVMGLPLFSSLPLALSCLCISTAAGAWYGMAFTGASTYTSRSGVRWEMRRALPSVALLVALGLGLWIWGFFS